MVLPLPADPPHVGLDIPREHGDFNAEPHARVQIEALDRVVLDGKQAPTSSSGPT